MKLKRFVQGKGGKNRIIQNRQVFFLIIAALTVKLHLASLHASIPLDTPSHAENYQICRLSSTGPPGIREKTGVRVPKEIF